MRLDKEQQKGGNLSNGDNKVINDTQLINMNS